MNGFSKNTDILKEYFCDQSLRALQSIFERTHIINNAKNLNLKLLSVLQTEESKGDKLMIRNTSPSGKNHIVIVNDLCFLINIHGFIIFMSNGLFYEGELDITNIHWIEADNLVLFDAYYIVHGDREKGICHYSNDENSFVFFYEEKKESRNTISAITESFNLIGYRYSVTGDFGFSFLYGNKKIVTVSSPVLPKPWVMISGNGINWESPYFDDTIIPGVSRYVIEQKTKRVVCKITFIQRGQYRLNDSVIVYCGKDELVFYRNNQQIVRITRCQEKLLIPASLDSYYDWRPFFEISVSQSVDNELLMLICAFPMLRFAD